MRSPPVFPQMHILSTEIKVPFEFIRNREGYPTMRYRELDWIYSW